MVATSSGVGFICKPANKHGLTRNRCKSYPPTDWHQARRRLTRGSHMMCVARAPHCRTALPHRAWKYLGAWRRRCGQSMLRSDATRSSIFNGYLAITGNALVGRVDAGGC